MNDMMMKWIRRSLVCTIALPVSVALIGCGAEDQGSTAEFSAEDGMLTEAQDVSESSDEADPSIQALEEESLLASSDEQVEKARNCQVACSLSGAQCTAAPGDEVGGFGSTSFLGGCDKCYRRAIDDARVSARGLFPGCGVVNCVKLSCD